MSLSTNSTNSSNQLKLPTTSNLNNINKQNDNQSKIYEDEYIYVDISIPSDTLVDLPKTKGVSFIDSIDSFIPSMKFDNMTKIYCTFNGVNAYLTSMNVKQFDQSKLNSFNIINNNFKIKVSEGKRFYACPNPTETSPHHQLLVETEITLREGTKVCMKLEHNAKLWIGDYSQPIELQKGDKVTYVVPKNG